MPRARGSQIYSQDVVEELKAAMAMESEPGQDDEGTFRHKVSGLQRFLNHGISRFSIDTWHQALTALYHSHHSSQEQDSRRPVVSHVKGLEDLRVLSRDVMLQREGGSMREADAHALKYLDNFLLALSCIRQANTCVSDLHRFMYRYYYIPDDGREHSRVLSGGKAMSRASSGHRVGPDGQPQGPSEYEVSARQFGILTQDQMSGSTGHKLRRTVGDMDLILQRWARLLRDQGEDISPEDLDPESEEDLHLLSGTSAFAPVLRLLPDVFAKFYKCLELLKQWWVLAHDIYPELPINRPLTPSTPGSGGDGEDGSSESELSTVDEDLILGRKNEEEEVPPEPLPQRLKRVEENIQQKEDCLDGLLEELKLLEERERHFQSLAEAYDKVTADFEEQTRQRKELGILREQELGVDSPPSHTTAAQQDELNEQVTRVERELQMLRFQQTLLRQDYMVQLEVRPSLIRFMDDLLLKIAQARNDLVEHKTERLRLLEASEDGEGGGGGGGGSDANRTNHARTGSPLHYNKASRKAERKDSVASQPRSRTSSVRSDSPLPNPPDPDRDPPKIKDIDKPSPAKSTDTDASRAAAERKQELSRLLSRPKRELTSESSVAGDTTTAGGDHRRKQPHPPGKRDDTDNRLAAAPPTIKIQRPSVDNSALSVDVQSLKKPARGQALNGKSSPRHRRISEPETQNRTELLFQRRHGKAAPGQSSSTPTDENGRQQLNLPVQRPRAKSDPNTQRADGKLVKLKQEQEEKVSPKTKDSKSSTRSVTNSDNSSPDSVAKKPTVHGRTGKVTSSEHVTKTAVTSSSPTNKSKDSKSPNSENTKTPTDAKKHVSPTSQTSRITDSKKHNGVAVSSKSPDSGKKDRNKALPPASKQSRSSPPGVQTDPQHKDDRKRHAVNPTQNGKITSSKPDDVRKGTNATTTSENGKITSSKPDDVRKGTNATTTSESGKITSSKPTTTQDDVRKSTNATTTSQQPKQEDKKSGRVAAPERRKPAGGSEEDRGDAGKLNGKAVDVKDAGKITSFKPSPPQRPNRVVARK